MTSRLTRIWRSLTGSGPAEPPPPPPRALTFARNPELEAKVEAALKDDAAWAIYGDWLQGQNDGRGELLALMGQGLDDQAAAWVTRHHDPLFGPIARYTHWLKNKKVPTPFVRYRPCLGPADPVHRRRRDAATAPRCVHDVQWDHGFVARVCVEARPDMELDGVELLRHVLRLPIFRFVRELGFGAAANDVAPYPELLALLETDAPPTLTRLVLGDFVYPDECEMSWAELADIDPVWRNKRLRALTLCAGSADPGTVDGAHLEHFARETGALTREELAHYFRGAWPMLTRFEVWTGTDTYGGDCQVDDLEPLFTGEKFPRLTHLGLQNTDLSDAIVERLATAPVLPRLTALDLSMGTLSHTGVDALLKHAAAFRHLSHLDLRDNYVPADRREALKAALPMVRGLEEQPKTQWEVDDPDDRYVTVSE